MNRRGFITGVGLLIAAPAIVRAASLMPINARLVPGRIIYIDHFNSLQAGDTLSIYGARDLHKALGIPLGGLKRFEIVSVSGSELEVMPSRISDVDFYPDGRLVTRAGVDGKNDYPAAFAAMRCARNNCYGDLNPDVGWMGKARV